MENSIVVNINEENEKVLETWHIYCLLVLGFVFVSWFSGNYIMTRSVYHQLFSEQMESYRIDDYFDAVSGFSIWTYLATPLLVWLKIAIVSFLIQLPLMMKFIELKFSELFRIVAIAQIPIFLSAFIKLIWLFVTPQTEYTNELFALVPLSITNLINTTNFSPAVNGFLTNINLFDFIWIGLLYTGLKNTKKLEKSYAFNVAFGLWLALGFIQLGLMLYLNNG